jgi:ribosome biogenesis GTPase A
MTASGNDDAETLLRTAVEVYDGDAEAQTVIAGLEQRLREPLRLAIAGMVKAGKSTLLNALLGEQIAPTDTAECTRVVTWYRYSATPTITMHPRDGQPQRMPVRRERGRLTIDLGEMKAEDVEWIDVGWPLGGLKSMIIIDTPGIASLSEDTSARARRFLTPEESPSSADAVVYLMRHLHGSDVRFLEAFRDTAAGAAQTVCAVGVLSRSY